MRLSNLIFAALLSVALTSCSRCATPNELGDRGPIAAPNPAPEVDPGALKPIMVGIGAHMSGIYAGLWQEDYAAISKLARAIAQHPSISPDELHRIRTTLGDAYVGFVQADHRVHQTAAHLAKTASALDLPATLSELAALQKGCVACHTRYRFQLAR